jgi:hypothetical protein
VHHVTNDVMTVEELLHSFSNFGTRCGGGGDAPEPLPCRKQGGSKIVP